MAKLLGDIPGLPTMDSKLIQWEMNDLQDTDNALQKQSLDMNGLEGEVEVLLMYVLKVTRYLSFIVCEHQVFSLPDHCWELAWLWTHGASNLWSAWKDAGEQAGLKRTGWHNRNRWTSRETQGRLVQQRSLLHRVDFLTVFVSLHPRNPRIKKDVMLHDTNHNFSALNNM